MCSTRTRKINLSHARYLRHSLNRVNAVDVIFAASPIYLYLNPDIIGYLLSPLLDAQLSPLYTNAFSAMDLGML